MQTKEPGAHRKTNRQFRAALVFIEAEQFRGAKEEGKSEVQMLEFAFSSSAKNTLGRRSENGKMGLPHSDLLHALRFIGEGDSNNNFSGGPQGYSRNIQRSDIIVQCILLRLEGRLFIRGLNKNRLKPRFLFVELCQVSPINFSVVIDRCHVLADSILISIDRLAFLTKQSNARSGGIHRGQHRSRFFRCINHCL